MRSLKITILYDSIEEKDRDEAQKSGENVPPLVSEQTEEVLTAKGHHVRKLAAGRDFKELARLLTNDDSDLVFNLSESFGGVSQYEQHVAALLEVLDKRFTGSGSIGLTLAQDKELSKKMFYFHGIPFPKFTSMDAGIVEWSDDLNFPLFVKPLNEDASIGIDSKSIVHNVKELMERISYMQTEFKAPALIEEYIEGREIYISVLGNDRPEALPILEWDFSKLPDGNPKIASSEAKWDEDSAYKYTVETFPTDIPPAVYKKIQETAIQAFKALKLRDYGRVDMRLRHLPSGQQKRKYTTAEIKKLKNGELEAPELAEWEFFVIEVNPNPYLDKKAELSMCANKHNLQYPDLIERIVELAIERTY